MMGAPAHEPPPVVSSREIESGVRGIGLALTRLVCERHGGEISVTNTPDGAMFTARMTVGHLTDVVAEGARG